MLPPGVTAARAERVWGGGGIGSPLLAPRFGSVRWQGDWGTWASGGSLSEPARENRAPHHGTKKAIDGVQTKWTETQSLWTYLENVWTYPKLCKTFLRKKQGRLTFVIFKGIPIVRGETFGGNTFHSVDFDGGIIASFFGVEHPTPQVLSQRSAREKNSKATLLFEFFLVNLHDVYYNAACRVHFLFAHLTFEVFLLLMLYENLLIVKFPVTVPATT